MRSYLSLNIVALMCKSGYVANAEAEEHGGLVQDHLVVLLLVGHEFAVVPVDVPVLAVVNVG